MEEPDFPEGGCANCKSRNADFLISLRRTAVGIYALRLLQLKLSGRLSQKAVLALGCCGEGDEDRDIIDVYEEVDKGIHI